MQACLFNLLFTALLLAVSFPVKAADTLKIHVTYRHTLPDGRYSAGRTVINQKIYTPNDTLFREVNYDTATHQVSGYVFYFYKEDRLFSEEYYNGTDSLLSIIKHTYDPAGNETVLSTYQFTDNALKLTREIQQTYDSGNRLMKKTTRAGKKTVQVIQYTYHASGRLATEIRKNNPSLNRGIRTETLEYTYDDTGRMIQTKHSVLHANKQISLTSEHYSYTPEGWIKAITVTNEKNEQVVEKSYEYLPSGHLKIYQEKNNQGLITLLLEYEYKKHYMNYGSQVSFFER